MRQEKQQVNDHPEAVRSHPVPVPGADDRSGPAEVPEDALDDRGTFDDPAVAGDADRTEYAERADESGRRPGPDDDERVVRAAERDADEGGFHDPGPVPTTFGAPTVGGAVAASALASPRPEDEPDPRDERTAWPGDGAEEGEREGLRADPTAELHRRDGEPEVGSRDSADLNESPDRAAPAPGVGDGDAERRGDLTPLGGDPGAGAAGAAGYGSAAPRMVDPDAVSPDADPAAAGASTTATGDLAAAGTSRPAGSTVAAEPATLFDAEIAQGFRDRWRDVQLRFVDDPRAAAGEAQALVEEAIQALSSALAAQRTSLGGWQQAGSADTEELRMAVRGYRDFLDRVLGR
ncbi:hypothetical protein [Micromonospora sp. NPDC093243]|uniref:hypothetical protein n=1 Tax=Micromonospora sp. NPDC093243 TaxID=3364290 RepID=UPI0038194A53